MNGTIKGFKWFYYRDYNEWRLYRNKESFYLASIKKREGSFKWSVDLYLTPVLKHYWEDQHLERARFECEVKAKELLNKYYGEG